jgi:predicted N-acetyltransferase YhbS
MTVEICRLAPREWIQLHKVADGFAPNPEHSVAIVAVNDSGDIIGRIFLVAPVHLEGLWIDETFRNKTLLYQLVQRGEEEAKAMGLTRVLAFGATPELSDYIERLGYTYTPMTVWYKDLI